VTRFRLYEKIGLYASHLRPSLARHAAGHYIHNTGYYVGHEINSESDCGLEVVACGLFAAQPTEACLGCNDAYGLDDSWKASGGSI
jgi:hypothetical protein